MASFPGGALRQLTVLLEPEVAQGVAEGRLQLEVMTRQVRTGLWDRRVPQIALPPEVAEAAVQVGARVKRNALPIGVVAAAAGLAGVTAAALWRRRKSEAADPESQVPSSEDARDDGAQEAVIVQFPGPVDDEQTGS